MKHALALLLFASTLTAATPPKPKPVPPPDLVNPPADAHHDAGLIWRELAPPTSNAQPSEEDIVKVTYTIWSSPDGRLIDATPPGAAPVVPLGRLMVGFRQALYSMRVGEERRIWIPESMGAVGKVPAGGMMVIDTKLVEIIRPPERPADVAAPPADAITTKSGLAYKVLRPGTGTKHPKKTSTVRVHYSGWLVSGYMFDSSVTRGEPVAFSLEEVVAGWREALPLMTEGERARFWIPPQLAYGDEPGKPHGMLVFDIELLKIVK
jgi:peptidylprolyl isomerase